MNTDKVKKEFNEFIDHLVVGYSVSDGDEYNEHMDSESIKELWSFISKSLQQAHQKGGEDKLSDLKSEIYIMIKQTDEWGRLSAFNDILNLLDKKAGDK